MPVYQKRIAEAREEYRPVAARGAISYFLVSEFSSVNCMYHTSLAQFAEVYDRSIDNSERAAMPAKRISNIVDYLTRELHDYVSRGLFEEHKLTFSLLLAIKILQQEGRVDPRALNTFCKGGKALDITQVGRMEKLLQAVFSHYRNYHFLLPRSRCGKSPRIGYRMPCGWT